MASLQEAVASALRGRAMAGLPFDLGAHTDMEHALPMVRDIPAALSRVGVEITQRLWLPAKCSDQFHASSISWEKE